jgi:pullulanase/glycogen debranching enzyme
MLLDGPAMREQDAQGNPITDDMLLLLLNATPEATPFTLPGPTAAAPWEVLLDTSRPDEQQFPRIHPGGVYDLSERALALLRRRR